MMLGGRRGEEGEACVGGMKGVDEVAEGGCAMVVLGGLGWWWWWWWGRAGGHHHHAAPHRPAIDSGILHEASEACEVSVSV